MRMGAGSENFDPGTIAHWEHVVQGFGRIEVLYALPEHRRPPYGTLDVAAYFVLAYHVRDYLIQLDGRDDVDEYINQNQPLARCRDLSVNLKHARMEHEPRSVGGKEMHLEAESADFPEGPGIYHRVLVHFEAGSVDAHTLAVQVYGAWHAYGLPLLDHTAEVWSYAERTEQPSGITTSHLQAPNSTAWRRPG